eukprot:4197241-Prymnesium_polylepis.1
MDRRTNRPTGLRGMCGAFVWRAQPNVAAAKGAPFLRRRPEIFAKRFSPLPSSFVEPYSEGT